MRIILLYCLDEYQKPQTTISRDPRDDMWLKPNCPFGIKRYDGGFLFHFVIYPNYPFAVSFFFLYKLVYQVIRHSLRTQLTNFQVSFSFSEKKRRMAATIDPSLSGLEMHKNLNPQGAVIDEIEGLIRVYKDGHVERLPIVPCVTCALAPDMGVTSRDIVIDKFTNIWARFYVPILCQSTKLPLLVYFHGGGFCVGSAAWSCYHEFLATLAKKAGCIIMSVNYRLAPENPLPAAYEDGFTSLMWLKQQATSSCGGSVDWLSRQCNFSSIFLAGDSAGANIAHNVALRLGNSNNTVATLKPLTFKGTILIQPFFGGEARTNSEKYLAQPPRSALSLAASDTYWRLALPRGSNRDHPWSNPMSKGSTELEQYCGLLPLPTLVCISEMDILKDRNLEFCSALGRADKRVEHVMYKGVGHAFQILSKSQLSLTRTHEMVVHIKAFITTRS